MAIFTKPEPLNDAELDRLGDFLKSCKGGKAMNVEQLDGLFAALIAGPETVLPLPRARRRPKDASRADHPREARGHHRSHGGWAGGGVSVFPGAPKSLRGQCIRA
jgi:hypothetical protein